MFLILVILPAADFIPLANNGRSNLNLTKFAAQLGQMRILLAHYHLQTETEIVIVLDKTLPDKIRQVSHKNVVFIEPVACLAYL